MRDPEFSVIICTRDRPQQMLSCLAAIAVAADRQTDLTVEIIVVENLSQPHLTLDPDAVQRVAKGRARFAKLLQGGLSNARNEGISLARGPGLVFTDDDCIMDPDYFSDLTRHRDRRGGNLFIGGRVTLGDPGDLPFTIKDIGQQETYTVASHPGGFVQGCNFAVSRNFVDRIGQFDTRFGAGALYRAGEDTDYIIRAHIAGLPIEYVPDMRIQHKHGRKQLADIEALNAAYEYANGALFGKYLRHGWLQKHLYWTLRAAIKERFGGPTFDARIGVSWQSRLRANLAGLSAYLFKPAGRSFPARVATRPASAACTSKRSDS